jgi:ferritin-like metal-binding protein YciE
MKDIHDLFIHELQLMYDGEKQIIDALPKVIDAVSSNKLKDALEDHLEETKEQAKRLESIFKELGKPAKAETSEVMESLLNEGEKVIQMGYEDNVKDAALINCCQHVEHFEIASYGILKSLAKAFKYEQILDLLEKSSKEEGDANKKLTEIAEGSAFSEGVNAKAKKRAA